MYKILIFNVIVGLLCACAYNYSEKGIVGLDFGFLTEQVQNIEN